MKILMVYPKYPDTFWSFKHALKFISKKAVHPPLGLLTVAGMLPEEWEKKLVDMNVESLKDEDVKQADYVFISAMLVQKDSVREVVARCNEAGVKIVAGGPLFTSEHDEFENIDHFVLNEAEVTLPRFLEDLNNGRPEKYYTSDEFPDLESTPIPQWELIKMKKYVSMNIQYSRGCPFNCDFCDITVLYGRKARTKNREQILSELERLYSTGWKSNVFFVDDNFIGNKKKLKEDILPAITEWMKEKKYPFVFSTEASVNMADDEELMDMMVDAGFDSVFVGIETPNEESLSECSKFQNKNRDLVESVRKIQKFGLRVRGGFIVGFDNDSPSIFDRQVEFIQKAGIISAMVGLLNAPRGTSLYKRIVKEGRLLNETTGSNTDFSINFIPKMDKEVLLSGYKNIINGIYSPKPYFKRVKNFLMEYKPTGGKPVRLKIEHTSALLKSIFVLGIKDKERIHYWKLFFWSLFKRPQVFPLAITYAIYGFQFRKYFAGYLEE